MKFHRLTLLERDCGRSADKHVLSRWKCDCGKNTVIAFSRVKHGYSKSCGCLGVDVSRAAATHGARKDGSSTREYRSWSAMRRRCLIPDDKDFPRYGGIGIKICDRWSDFALFLEDMGKRPAGKTLERIDSMKGYEPGNVKWGDHFEQARNRRNSQRWLIKGLVFQHISAAANHFGVSEQTIHRWVNGAYDSRRGTFTKARDDCSSERKYK